MKVITIGSDKKLFEEDSAVLERAKDYASKIEEMYTIVFSLKKDNLSPKNIGNLHIYPTNSDSRIGYIFDAIRLGKNIISRNNFKKENSVISTQDPFESGFVGYKLKVASGLPLQFQIHTDFLSSYFKNSFLNKIRVPLAKFLIPKADGLRVVSSVIDDSIKNKFPNLKAKVDILPIFVDVEVINNIIASREQVSNHNLFKKNILMNARLSKEKRFDVALKTFKNIILKDNDVGLIILGSGPEYNNIKKMVEDFGLDKKVSFKGTWENIHIASLFYKLSDIFLLTSDYEGYGMTLIEAGAAGCPIVTTEVGIAKTDLFKNGENSFVCPVGDVDCLSKAIIDLITDEQKRKSFSDNMRDSIKSTAYSKEEYVPKYIALLEGLINKTQ